VRDRKRHGKRWDDENPVTEEFLAFPLGLRRQLAVHLVRSECNSLLMDGL
jgi:hypothetical protein